MSPRKGFGVPQDRTQLSQVTFPPVQGLGGRCGTPSALLSPSMCVAGRGDISTCGIPEEVIFQVFPRFLLLLHVA